jgi:hypothetical protein
MPREIDAGLRDWAGENCPVHDLEKKVAKK